MEPTEQTATLDELDLLRLKDEAGADVWDECVTRGQKSVEDEDKRRWESAELGYIIARSAKYGDAHLKRYASEINLRPRTLSERVQVFGFWGKETILRWRSECPIILYTHIRCAMRIANKRMDTPLAIQFIEDCMVNLWRAGKAELEADILMDDGTPGNITLESGATIVGFSKGRVTLALDNAEVLAALPPLQSSQRLITVKIVI